MQIINELKTRKIEITVIESIKEHYPSHRIQIEIETENIKANFNNHVWVGDTDLESFIKELIALDKSRIGEASIESMSPGEMKLLFKSTDNAGHISVLLQYGKKSIHIDYSYDLQIEFQVDPTSLPGVISGFQQLIK